MLISGHRNEPSLVHYIQRPSSFQLKGSSEVIFEALGNNTEPSPAIRKKPAVGIISQTTVTKATTIACADFGSSTSRGVSLQGLPDFAGMFNNCLISSVNVNFNHNS